MGSRRVGMARTRSLVNENLNQLKLRNEQIISVGAAETKVLTAGDSGALVYLGGAGVATATLPAAAAGLNFRFYATSAQVHIINGGASVMQGAYHHNTGATTIVRVANDPDLILRLLDGGAQGVHVPRVNTASDAQTVVEACRFHPQGQVDRISRNILEIVCPVLIGRAI